MNYQDYKAYFGAAFQGMGDFLTNVINPIATLVEKGNEHKQNYAVTDYVQICADANINAIFDFGKYNVGGAPVSVFEVVLDDNCNIARARKNIQTVIRKMIGTFSGSFIIFHYADNSSRNDKDTWRFSWVMTEDSQSHSTSAKRYTYLCGPSYSCRTIAERFVELEKGKKDLPSITKAFDVEALSDEFFKEYKVIYDDIVQWITGKRIVREGNKWEEFPKNGQVNIPDTTGIYQRFLTEFNYDDKEATKAVCDYVKKLLGRLVFIQFLQKKEWLKIDGKISTNFLLDLFNVISDESRDNFIEAALEKVVYLLLNNENREKDSEIIDKHKLGVPFLNGGLFERDQYDNFEIKLPKEFFHNETCKEEKRELSETKLRDNDNFFSQCGILDLFNQYNFTIDENDPNDAEVGVDPEMLGKIFENLLEDNKKKGAYYTPKEIVQYMCNESLIAYLQNKVPNHDDEIRQFVLDAEQKMVPEDDKILNAIKEVKICDPAIGSGAFPMGLLNLLVALREKLEPSAQRVEQKKNIIQNNIYGVDIEKGAIDIARLRFWLSIMVDEESPTPLPNFEYKFMQGNSLLTTFDLQYVDIKQAKENRQVTAEINKKKQDLYKKKNEFYKLSGEAKYKKEVEIKLLIVDILKLRLGFERLSVERQDTTRQMELFAAPDMPQNSRSKKKIQEVKAAWERVQRLIEKLLEIEKQLKDQTKSWEERAKTDILFFDWEICFAEIFPQEKTENDRGFDIVIGNPPYIQLQSNKGFLANLYESKGYSTFDREGDIYALFYELGCNILKTNAALCYITSDKWMCTASGEKLRDYLLKNTNPIVLIDFRQTKLFDDATVETNILLYTKSKYIKDTHCSLLFRLKRADRTKLHQLIRQNTYIDKFDSSSFWFVTGVEENFIRIKLANKSVTLSNEKWGIKINRGVLTGDNDVFKISSEQRDSILAQCGSDEEKAKTNQLLIPLITGTQTDCYYSEWKGSWLIATFPSKHYDIDEFPALKAFLLSFGIERLEQTGRTYIVNGKKVESRKKNLSNKWFETQDTIAFWEDFYKPKLFWKRVGSIIRFSYDENGMACLDSTCIATGNNLKFLTGFFNSNVGHFLLQFSPRTGTGDLLLSKQAIEPCKVYVPNEDQNEAISQIVDEIIYAKQKSPHEDTTSLEHMIDVLIYMLYGLTWDEVQVIENSLAPADENSETEGSKKKTKKKVQLKAKLDINEAIYTKWLERYQKEGTLPSEEEMKNNL